MIVLKNPTSRLAGFVSKCPICNTWIAEGERIFGPGLEVKKPWYPWCHEDCTKWLYREVRECQPKKDKWVRIPDFLPGVSAFYRRVPTVGLPPTTVVAQAERVAAVLSPEGDRRFTLFKKHTQKRLAAVMGLHKVTQAQAGGILEYFWKNPSKDETIRKEVNQLAAELWVLFNQDLGLRLTVEEVCTEATHLWHSRTSRADSGTTAREQFEECAAGRMPQNKRVETMSLF